MNNAATDVVTWYILRSIVLPWACCAAAGAMASCWPPPPLGFPCPPPSIRPYVLPWPCSFGSAATLLYHWIRSRPYVLAVLGHGRMPPLCQAMAGCCLTCEAVAPCGRPWLSAGRQLLPLCDAVVCMVPLCACCLCVLVAERVPGCGRPMCASRCVPADLSIALVL